MTTRDNHNKQTNKQSLVRNALRKYFFKTGAPPHHTSSLDRRHSRRWPVCPCLTSKPLAGPYSVHSVRRPQSAHGSQWLLPAPRGVSGAARPRGESAATPQASVQCSFLVPMGPTMLWAYRHPARVVSSHPSELWRETQNTFPPIPVALEAVQSKGRKEKQKPTAGVVHGVPAVQKTTPGKYVRALKIA